MGLFKRQVYIGACKVVKDASTSNRLQVQCNVKVVEGNKTIVSEEPIEGIIDLESGTVFIENESEYPEDIVFKTKEHIKKLFLRK